MFQIVSDKKSEDEANYTWLLNTRYTPNKKNKKKTTYVFFKALVSLNELWRTVRTKIILAHTHEQKWELQMIEFSSWAKS